jgi:hypothetical protein
MAHAPMSVTLSVPGLYNEILGRKLPLCDAGDRNKVLEHDESLVAERLRAAGAARDWHL